MDSYVIKVTGANAGESHWATVSASVVGPMVTAIVPAHNQAGVALDTLVTVDFDRTMDASSINTNTLRLLSVNVGYVTSTVSCNSPCTTATLTPNFSLDYSVPNLVEVEGEVRDVLGRGIRAITSPHCSPPRGTTNRIW